MQSSTAKTTSPPKTTATITTSKLPATKPAETNTIITSANTKTEPIEITETETLIPGNEQTAETYAVITVNAAETEPVEITGIGSVITGSEQTTVFTETSPTEIGSVFDIEDGGADPNLIILIVLIILAALGGVGYYFWKKKQGQSKTSDEKTAQDFINARDTGDNCLYTIDEKVFVYLKIDGISLELYEAEEIEIMSKTLAAALVPLRFPKKFLTVSQPMDLKTTLQKYTMLQQNATTGHKALLDQEISELVSMAERGETQERQYYAAVWGNEENEEEVKNNANDLLKALTNNGVSAEILDKDGIAELCNLVNIPAYSHMENSWDFGDELLEAIIR